MYLDNSNEVSLLLLGGNLKCLQTIPGKDQTYLGRALEEAMQLGCQIILVIDPSVSLPESDRLRRVPPGAKLFDSLQAGLAVCQTPHVLVLATDLPEITAAAIHQFLLRGLAAESDVCIALARLIDCEAVGHRTDHPVPLNGDLFKFGSTFLFSQRAVPRILRAVKELLELRKSPVALARRLISWRSALPVARFAVVYGFFWAAGWLKKKETRFAWCIGFAVMIAAFFLCLLISVRFSEAEQLLEGLLRVRAKAIVGPVDLVIDHD